VCAFTLVFIYIYMCVCVCMYVTATGKSCSYLSPTPTPSATLSLSVTFVPFLSVISIALCHLSSSILHCSPHLSSSTSVQQGAPLLASLQGLRFSMRLRYHNFSLAEWNEEKSAAITAQHIRIHIHIRIRIRTLTHTRTRTSIHTHTYT